MAGYIRQDTDNDISNGSIIDADVFDAEYDAIVAAFHASTGHKHDGTAAEGAPITKLGPNQEYVGSITSLAPKTTATYDLGSDALRFNSGYFSSVRALGSGGGNFLASSVLQAAASGHYTWEGNSGCSMYRSAVNVIEFATSSLSRLTIGSTGAVSIAQTLSVAGAITATGGVVGNATTATSLANSRTFSITGGATAAAVSFDGSGNVALNITDLNATNLTSGTVPVDRFGTSSAKAEWVGARTSELGSGNIGVIAMARFTGSTSSVISFRDDVNGSNLRACNVEGSAGTTFSGTWKCLGTIPAGATTNAECTSLWVKTA